MSKLKYVLFVYVISVNINIFSTTDSKNRNDILSRKKRYAVFPEGSTWSIAICSMTQAIVPNNNGIWTEAINWGISYDLPNDTSQYAYFLYPNFEHERTKRESRRGFYNNVEKLLESVGYDGKACIYRTLCEAARFFATGSSNLSEEILRIIFKFPLKRLVDAEPEDHRLYHRAYRVGLDDDNEKCSDIFPNCPFSLIDIFLSGFTNF